MNMNERIYYSNEAARRAMAQRNLLALVAAGLGLALGAVIALVLAPRSGEQTRRLFGEQIGNGLETVGKVAQSGVETVGKVANTVREAVEERINHN